MACLSRGRYAQSCALGSFAGERPGFVGWRFLAWIQTSAAETLGSQLWEWQRGCFDRLLRSDENLQRKWIYVMDNPVRQGLVQKAEDWPYYLDFVNCGGSCQLPLQFRGIGG